MNVKKITMYSSALAMMVALSACNSSSTPATTPPPVEPPVVTPTGPLTKSGTTATYRNGDTGESSARAGAYRIKSQANVDAQVAALATTRTKLATAQSALASLEALPDFVGPNAVLAEIYLAEYNTTLVAGSTYKFDSSEIAAPNAKAAILKKAKAGIKNEHESNIAGALNALRIARKASPTEGGNKQEIVLADGTVLQTESQGRVSANEQGAFVNARTVAAYEEDAQGRITRVAFLEASGGDYTAANSGVGTYTASGTSQFFVKVGGDFFDQLNGSSKVNMNLVTQSGNVEAAHNSTGKALTYRSDVTFDPATGAFKASNGRVVYTTTTNTQGGTGGETLTANNAQILGQLHGQVRGANEGLTNQWGADYTGVVTAKDGRLEAVGTIIGSQSSSFGTASN